MQRSCVDSPVPSVGDSSLGRPKVYLEESRRSSSLSGDRVVQGRARGRGITSEPRAAADDIAAERSGKGGW